MNIEHYKYLNNKVTMRELNKLKLNGDEYKTFNLNIIRTMPFEYVASKMSKFMQLFGLEIDCEYSDYDVALSDLLVEVPSDGSVFWIDWRLYMESLTPDQTINWLKKRILKVDGPCLINNWPIAMDMDELIFNSSMTCRDWVYEFNFLLTQLKKEMLNIEIIDLNVQAVFEEDYFYDRRNDEVSNYPFSNQFTLRIARHIGLNLVPALFFTRLKAIVVDLDNTLYKGILGEDGIDGLEITENHRKLQTVLKKLKESGILLAICSKNDKEDVLELINGRSDLGLKENDFTFIEANWQSKYENLLCLANNFNFDVSAMLFLDDNPGEIAQVNAHIPQMHTLLADDSGIETVYRLINFPYLYARQKDELVDQRQKDIVANQERKRIENLAGTQNEYLNSLKMNLTIYENEPSHIQRVFDMSHKTNQFNLALKRLSKESLNEKVNSNQNLIYTIGLSDLLSDSGIIGVFICSLSDSRIVFEEVLFSCRSLNRRVEDISLLQILEKISNLGITDYEFDWKKGSRNEPALNWLASFANSKKLDDLISILKERTKDILVEVNLK